MNTFIAAVITEQNTYVIGSSILLIVTSLFWLLSVYDTFNKIIRTLFSILFGLCCCFLVYFNYNSIQKPLEFKKEMDSKYAAITQRLKDIRESQKTFKNVNKRYAPTFDTLIAFIDTGKVPVLKAFGNIPDGLTEAEAIKQGYYKKEILKVPAKESIFSKKYMKTRNSAYNLVIDSLSYIPSTANEKFVMTTGEVVKNNVTVNTLEVAAPNDLLFKNWEKHFYAGVSDRKFGSTSDPSLNGNWE